MVDTCWGHRPSDFIDGAYMQVKRLKDHLGLAQHSAEQLAKKVPFINELELEKHKNAYARTLMGVAPRSNPVYGTPPTHTHTHTRRRCPFK